MLTGIENFLPTYRDWQERQFAPYNELEFDPMDDVDDGRKPDVPRGTNFHEDGTIESQK